MTTLPFAAGFIFHAFCQLAIASLAVLVLWGVYKDERLYWAIRRGSRRQDPLPKPAFVFWGRLVLHAIRSCGEVLIFLAILWGAGTFDLVLPAPPYSAGVP